MKRKFTLIYALITAFYLFMVSVFPVDQATMDRRALSLSQARIISLTVAIPMIIIWFIALFCSLSLHEYSRTIKNSRDGAVLLKLSYGILLIAWYLPIRAVVKIVLNYVASRHPSSLDAMNIIITYVNLLIPLAAFVIISRSAHELGRLAKIRNSLGAIYGLGLVFIFLSVAYCYTAFSVKGAVSPSNWLLTPQGALALPVRILTIFIPSLFMWFIGLIAVYQIHLYQRQVKGVVYRQTWHLLSVGLIAVIVLSIAVQFLTTTAGRLQSLPFAAVLFIAYSLIILLGTAFIIMAKGVRQIKKLDEI